MLSAFQLENNRLTRLEVEESQPLVNAVWIDLCRTGRRRATARSNLNLARAWQPARNWKTSKHRHVSFEDDDGLHIHSFFFFEDAEDHAGNSTVAFTIRDGRLFTLRERELPAFRLYRMRARSQSMVDGNAYELLLICSKPKSNSWQMKLKISIATGAVEPGDYGRASGDEYDEALSTLAELEDIGWKSSPVSDGYPARAQLPA